MQVLSNPLLSKQFPKSRRVFYQRFVKNKKQFSFFKGIVVQFIELLFVYHYVKVPY